MKSATGSRGRLTRKTLLAVIMSMAGIAAAEARIIKQDAAWGENCNNRKSYAVKMKNTSNVPKDFRVCLERTNGRWSCYANLNTKPGEVYPTSWGFMVCEGTGQIKWWERETGSRTPFGDP